jgi:predicted ATPase
MKRIVITGGPGAGKSTLLNALSSRGFSVVEETARIIIQRRMAQGLSPRPTAFEFAREVLHEDIRKFGPAAGAGCVYFDRGLVDALGMLEEVAPLPPNELESFVRKYPYHRQVFFLAPWEDIYAADDERDQTLVEAIRIGDSLAEWYRRCRYELIEVPKVSIAERCEYVLQAIDCKDA